MTMSLIELMLLPYISKTDLEALDGEQKSYTVE